MRRGELAANLLLLFGPGILAVLLVVCLTRPLLGIIVVFLGVVLGFMLFIRSKGKADR